MYIPVYTVLFRDLNFSSVTFNECINIYKKGFSNPNYNASGNSTRVLVGSSMQRYFTTLFHG